MFSRRTLFARMRDAAVVVAAPTFGNSIWRGKAHAQESRQSQGHAGGFAIMPFDNHPYGAPPLTFGERYEGSAQATMLTIWGREIWGFPKIAADTNVSRQENQATSYVRAGIARADVVLQLQDAERVEPGSTLYLYCRKTIPSPDNQGPDLDRIIEIPWRHTPENRISAKVERFDVELDVRGKAIKLPTEGYVDAFWFTQGAGTILDKGKVVHDYLA